MTSLLKRVLKSYIGKSSSATKVSILNDLLYVGHLFQTFEEIMLCEAFTAELEKIIQLTIQYASNVGWRLKFVHEERTE